MYTLRYTQYRELNTLYARNRMTEQIISERKIAKGFSSNVEGDGPLMSEITFISTWSSAEDSQESLSSKKP